ncbi:MAG: hypothetical protein HN472_07255 [Nitrospina sp.]|jgi:hypothetical protein|nr:hypothetical protein [Nitrospina sp.]MBT3509325.1 hypothetical protein [Nitrospina sp.]MBT3876119.1 hypothetical protein [Nitrospina sp.]MBT4048876.1 hypothetical protein [Nitrospina sp.]MBT4557585.1 hypothetical protein [Nitrospina sp.]
MTKSKIHLTLFLFFFSVYALTGQGSIQSADGKIMFLLTEAMVENHSVSFSEMVTLNDIPGPQYSKYGLGMSVLAIPFYLLGKVLSFLLGIEASMATQFAVSMINTILTAFCCLMVFRFATDRLDCNPRISLILALGFGLSTIAWYYSEDFMSEPAITLFLLLAVYCVTSKNSLTRKRDLIWAGIFLALAVFCKLVVLIAIPGFIMYQWMVWAESDEKNVKELTRDLIRPAIPVITVLILIMFYNYVRFADPLETGYEKFNGKFVVGFFGLLFSPGKSLFLFNPLTLFGCLGFMLLLREQRKIAILFGWLIISHLLLFSSWWSWQGGMSWGPRLMLVVIPYLILPAGFLLRKHMHAVKIPILVVLVAGILIQLPSVTVNIARYYYEMSKEFGSHGHNQILFSPKYSQLIGQFKQVAVVFDNLGDEIQMAQMASMAKKGERFLGADISVVLDNGLAVNAPNFWWYYMRVFGYPFYFWLLPPVALVGVIVLSGYKLYRETGGS